MRAHEFINEGKSEFRGITLRQLNKEKHDYMRRKASLERRQRLIPIIYGNPGKAHEQLEFEKAQLELEQQKAELVAARREARIESDEAIVQLAKDGAKAGQVGRSKVADLARTEMRRRKT